MKIGVIAQCYADCVQKVTLTRLCETEQECIQEIWNKFVDEEYIACSTQVLLESISEQWDTDFIYNPGHPEYDANHTYAKLCRRLIPAEMFERATQDQVSWQEMKSQLKSQVMSADDIRNVIDELSTISTIRRMTECTFHVEDVV